MRSPTENSLLPPSTMSRWPLVKTVWKKGSCRLSAGMVTASPLLPTSRSVPLSTASRTARVTADHCEQGWRLLCNGVIAFDDGGDLLPDGHSVRPQLAGWVTPHAA